MRPWFRFGLIALGLAVFALAACVPAPTPSAPKELKNVRFGYNKQLTDGPFFRLPDHARKVGIEIEFQEAVRYPELLTALARNDVDITSMGYPQATQTVEQNIRNVRFISGFGTGGTALTVNKQVKITEWKDLEGKKIGVFPGGPGDLNFRASLAKNGVDVSKIDVVKLTIVGAPLYQALRARDVDGYVGWEPFGATPYVEGFGYYAPLDLWDNDAKGVNQSIAANSDWLARNSETAVTLLKLINEEMIYLKSHEQEWASLTQEVIGLQPAIFLEAIKHFNLDTDLPFKLKEAQAMSRYMAQYGMAQGDFSAQIPDIVDYTYLEKATGKTRAQLGGG